MPLLFMMLLIRRFDAAARCRHASPDGTALPDAMLPFSHCYAMPRRHAAAAICRSVQQAPLRHDIDAADDCRHYADIAMPRQPPLLLRADDALRRLAMFSPPLLRRAARCASATCCAIYAPPYADVA